MTARRIAIAASVLAIVVAIIVIAVVASDAHPGGLDATSCHDVHKDFTYTTGRMVAAGSRHCHPSPVAGTAALMWDLSTPVDEIELPDKKKADAPERKNKEGGR